MAGQSRRRKWLKRVFWILVSLIAIFFLGVVPYGLSWLIVNGSYHFPDPDSGKTPSDYGLDYERVEFVSDPGILLRGWFIPAQSSQNDKQNRPHEDCRETIVLVHGLNRSRVEMLSRGVFLAKNGYNALLFDLRHHGESGGKISSLGYYESNDVVSAINYLRDQKHLNCPVALWGVSMGATASLLAYARSPEVCSAIADSPFLSFEDTIVHHAHLLLGLPRFPIVDLILLLTSHRLGIQMKDFDLRKTVREIGPRPILFVAGTADRRMPPEIARTLYGIASSPQKEILIVERAKHGEAYRTNPQEYQQAVLGFLSRTSPHF